MIMTLSKSIPKVKTLEMDAGANVLNFPNKTEYISLVMLADAALDEEESASLGVLDALLMLLVEGQEEVAALDEWTLALFHLNKVDRLYTSHRCRGLRLGGGVGNPNPKKGESQKFASAN